jgi:hypothetical protein
LKHPNFFTVKDDNLNEKAAEDGQTRHTANKGHSPNGRIRPTRSSTTSFLTAAELVFAIGAGITAAAGTRLALQLILDGGFKALSLHLKNPKGSLMLFLVTTSPSRY